MSSNSQPISQGPAVQIHHTGITCTERFFNIIFNCIPVSCITEPYCTWIISFKSDQWLQPKDNKCTLWILQTHRRVVHLCPNLDIITEDQEYPQARHGPQLQWQKISQQKSLVPTSLKTGFAWEKETTHQGAGDTESYWTFQLTKFLI